MTAPTPQEIQTDINTVYRTAIMSILTHSNEALTNTQLTAAILSGSMEAEVRMQVHEPYIVALIQLVIAKEVACYTGDDGKTYHTIYERVDAADSDASREGALAIDEKYPNEGNSDNPANWRTPTSKLIDELNAEDVVRAALRHMMERTQQPGEQTH